MSEHTYKGSSAGWRHDSDNVLIAVKAALGLRAMTRGPNTVPPSSSALSLHRLMC